MDPLRLCMSIYSIDRECNVQKLHSVDYIIFCTSSEHWHVSLGADDTAKEIFITPIGVLSRTTSDCITSEIDLDAHYTLQEIHPSACCLVITAWQAWHVSFSLISPGKVCLHEPRRFVRSK